MNKLLKKLSDWIPPDIAAKVLVKEWGEAGLIWLDGDGSTLGRWITIAVDPIEEISCRRTLKDTKETNPFEILRNLDSGHWTGWLSYEAGAWTEPSNHWKIDSMATLWIASHDPILKFDLHKKEVWIEGLNKARVNKFENLLNNYQIEPNKKKSTTCHHVHKKKIGIPLKNWEWLTTKDEYARDVNKIKQLIQQGDIFQANLSACCQAQLPQDISALDIYFNLRESSPSPFSGLIVGKDSTAGEAVISSSPERFLKVLPTGEVETRPIKGTRPRNNNPTKDWELAADLISSTKDRAENIMIVDLLRNDLGRVCKPGSIKVPQLVGLETFAHVHHLTSIIKGCLDDSKKWVDVLEAAWPGGSITGAPKFRACKRINSLEPIARGPYCGSIINLKWDGTFDSNILIRSLMVNKSTIRAHAGCGIVADSEATKESAELEWKLIPLLKALR